MIAGYTAALLIFASTICACELSQVGQVVAALNDSLRRSDAIKFASLFALDGDLWYAGELVAKGQTAIKDALCKPGAWTEVTAPRVEDEGVRIVSAGVALVDAKLVRYGSLIIKETAPLTIVLKCAEGQWKIVTLRIVPPCLMRGPHLLRRPED